LLGVFKEAYQMGAMLFSYSMFTFCPFFGQQNFLDEKSTFQFGPIFWESLEAFPLKINT
jgi:hypothetical protein